MKTNKAKKAEKAKENATATATANPAEIATATATNPAELATLPETTETATAEVFEATPETACTPATAEQEQTARAPRGKLQVGVVYNSDSGASVAITASDNTGAFTLYQISVNGEQVTTPLDSPNVKRVLTAATLTVNAGEIVANGATIKPRGYAAKRPANGDHAPRTATKLHTTEGATQRAAALYTDIANASQKLHDALEAVQRFNLNSATLTELRNAADAAAADVTTTANAAQAAAQHAAELATAAELARSEHADAAAANADNLGETAEAAQAATAAANAAAEEANAAAEEAQLATLASNAADAASRAAHLVRSVIHDIPTAYELANAIQSEATAKLEQAKATQAARKEAAAALNNTDPATAAQLAQLLKDPAKLAAVLATLNN